MKCSKYIFTLAMIGILGTSCGLERDQASRSPASGVGQILAESARDLNQTEVGIATRICYAFRNKRLNFSNIHLNDSYSFSESTNDCNSAISSSTDDSTIASDVTSLYFSNSGSVSFRIETDTYGYLADTCGKLTRGESAQNMTGDNGESILLTFSTSGGIDYFGAQIAYSVSINTANVIRQAHEYGVITSGSNSSTLGLVSSYTRTSVCSNSSDSSNSFKRTYNP